MEKTGYFCRVQQLGQNYWSHDGSLGLTINLITLWPWMLIVQLMLKTAADS